MESFLFCHRLGHGGMAEAFLALQRGIGGFEKLVVVKRMHPHLRYDDDLVRLFVNEARLAATIRHPNVVQMLNVRRNERELFIIMEYLSGESLFDMLRAVAEAHRLVPIHIACKIGADLASGLEAGHSVAIGGRPRPVIHRDVTPSNILVGYDGLTRLLDFGIAEGLTAGERNGPQRGKIGYLAPEQLEDGFADERTDIWQLGAVLYELVSGQRLYSASTMPALREQMQRSFQPLARLRPDVPGLLDATIRNALDRSPSARPASALELRETLLHIANVYEGGDGDGDVARWMRESFPDLYIARREIEQSASAGRVDDDDLEFLSTLIPRDDAVSSSAGEPVGTYPADSRTLSPLVVFGLFAILAAMFAGVVALQRAMEQTETVEVAASLPPPPPADVEEPKAFTVQVNTVPTTATLELNGETVGVGAFARQLARDGRSHTLVVSADGYLSKTLVFRDAAPESLVTLEATAEPEPPPPPPEPAETYEAPRTDNLDPWAD